MGDIVQIMVLPTANPDGRPQILLDTDGIWRDTALPQGDLLSQAALKSRIEKHLRTNMAFVDADAKVPPEGIGFKSPFMALYHDLLPIEVRDELKRVAANAQSDEPPLLKIFTASAEWIPWELLHDTTDFLGLRFLIARLPIVKEATEVRGARERKVESVFSLLGKDILQDTIYANWEKMFSGFSLKNGWERRYPPDSQGGGFPTVDQFEEAKHADVVHLTCHGGLLRADSDRLEYYWTLDHNGQIYTNYEITTEVAKRVSLERRPLVFGNACASIATQIDQRGSLYDFGANFMIGGALNFVGTFAPITKRLGVEFARRFYVNLFGKPRTQIAKTLWATKRSFRADGATDPSYLFYCLYGPPDVTYEVSSDA